MPILALAANSAASALVGAALKSGKTGDGVLAAMSVTTLSGGL